MTTDEIIQATEDFIKEHERTGVPLLEWCQGNDIVGDAPYFIGMRIAKLDREAREPK